ncbi:MAG: class I SAM-dependent rRNA methyltransferase [Desulfomonilaceae bacterium]
MITLKKKADRRVRRGHLWLFSNEIADPPVAQLETGSIHEVQDAVGEFLGMAYANPASLIAARILSHKKVPIDEAFLEQRIGAALERRQRLFPERDFYRLIFGEADRLPGLIVDRYGAVLAVQSLTAGMDALLDDVLAVLVRSLAPEGIYLRNDSSARTLEGLPQEKRLAYGAVPDNVTISSSGLKFLVDVADGQKTGFFLDQEANRPLMKQYVSSGDKVLDLFCHTGAWGLHAAAAGAVEVTGVDSSRGAIELAESNAALNGMEDRFHAIRANALEFLKRSRETWDVVILDPPAFIKSRSQIKAGQKGYIDYNRRALTKINPGGILVTCSCSHHLDAQTFEETLAIAARQSGKELRILDIRGQGPDHPFLLSMPETRYLKVIVAQIV